MHAIELIILAAKLALQGRTTIRLGGTWPKHLLNDYWCCSKVRLDHWYSDLKAHHEASQNPNWQCRLAWPLVEEILASEVLTRVWAAAATARDRRQQREDAEPLVRSILIGHMEARNRALRLVLYAPGVDADDAVQLNRLRNQVERWTDLLIGSLLSDAEVSDFAVDPLRAKDFADDFSHHASHETAAMGATLLASLRQGFADSLVSPEVYGELNQQIYSSIRQCFRDVDWQSSVSDETVPPWLERILETTETTEQLLMLLEADFAGRIGGS